MHDPARIAVLRSMCLEGLPSGPVLDRMTRLAARLLHAPVALGTVVEADRQILASAYDLESRYKVGSAMPLAYSFCQYTIAQAEPFVVEDARTHPKVRENLAVTENGVLAYAGTPLIVGDQRLGSLCVMDFVPRVWSDEDLGILRDLAAGAGAELELHRALGEARGRAEAEASVARLEAVQRVTDVALRHHSLDDLLAELLKRIRDALAADSATLLLLSDDGNWLDVRATSGLEVNVETDERIPFGQGFAGRIAATGEPAIVGDVSRAEIISPMVLKYLRSVLGVPLFAGDKVFGVMHVGAFVRRDFSADDLRLLELVAERAASAIQTAQLRERERVALVDAEKANRAKSQFLAVMSHELRTPLNIIGGYARLLGGEEGAGNLTQKERGWLNRILESQGHLLLMINRILRYSELESGSGEFRVEGVDVKEMLSGLSPYVEEQCRSKGLAFKSIGCDVPARVLADSESLAQILNDITGNAIRFTHRGGRITISCRTEPGFVLIEVQDTGIGIAPDRMEQLFARFVQADQSLTREHDGIGLSLSLGRALARAMNGDIELRSEIGVGTTATVRLRSVPRS